MSFESNFYLSGGPSGATSTDIVLRKTMDRGLTSIDNKVGVMSKTLEATFNDGIARCVESQEASSEIIAEEIRYQTAELMKGISGLSSDIGQYLHAVGDYLGAEISQVRWAVDQNTSVTKELLDVQLKSHWNDSRQSYEEGVKCFDAGEKEYAKEQFEKAVKACITNSFAHQYLGFIAVDANNQEQALRSFELAMKFAPDARQRATACYLLSRGWLAAGDLVQALQWIREALESEPDNKTYRYELVHALMRTGDVPEAVQQLRSLIEVDWTYWSLSASDRSLDPMHGQITQLLTDMREEQRVAAETLLCHLEETIQLLERFDGLVEELILGSYIKSANKTLKNLRKFYDTGLVFSYLAVCRQLPLAHQSIVQDAVANFRAVISKVWQNVADEEESILAKLNEKWSEAYAIQAEGEKQLQELSKREAEGSGGCLAGCGTLFLLLALYVLAIVWGAVHSAKTVGAAKGDEYRTFVVFLMISLLFFLYPVLLALKRSVERREGKRLLAISKLEFNKYEKERAKEEKAMIANKADARELEARYRDRISQINNRLSSGNSLLLEEAEKIVMPDSESSSGVDTHVVRSPIVGKFCDSETPGDLPFVKIGQFVDIGDTLCIIEAMNLRNEIESDIMGCISEVHVKNGDEVGYGESLYTLKLSGEG